MTWNSEGPDSGDSARIAALEAAVAELRRQLAAVQGQLTDQVGQSAGQSGTADAAQSGVDPWLVAPWPELVSLIRAGKKIEAIKVYRETFQVGLQEAKEAVEEVERRL